MFEILFVYDCIAFIFFSFQNIVIQGFFKCEQ